MRWFNLNSRPERSENGDIVWDGVVLDITNEAKGRVDQIAERVPGLICQCVLRTDGVDWVSYVGSQCRELFEVEPEAAIENSDVLWDRVHPDDIAKLHQARLEAIETLEQKMVKFRVVLPQRGERWLQIFSHHSQTQTEDGSILSDSLIIDITENRTG